MPYREAAQHFPNRSVAGIQDRMSKMRKRMGYARRPGQRKRGDKLAEGHPRLGIRPPQYAPMMGLMDAGLPAEQVREAKRFLQVLWHAGEIGRLNGWPVDVSNVIAAFREGAAG